ncbi:MAG TPA: MFS transporter [Baekduia sp.]|uniref:MFS transporter n=1 Tax=Baekduia sp. TaxID=2600305 RepID=UPI002D7759AC|nr:MFS transporter [Baekduia sp.]HET6505151.1 MFS transporter [Baekduia sp.]
MLLADTAATIPAVRRLPHTAAFWAVTATLAFLLFASSAPSPLYVVYQQRWHFSPLTLTSVFAVYVLALLVALVFAGSLSDRVGRRPVLLGALSVQLVAMVLFGVAHGVGMLFAARIVQGFATGVATGALSATLIDLAPERRPHLGALLSAAAPPMGLALGALGSGLLVQYGPDPLRLVYWLLVVVFALAIAVVYAMPETVRATHGWTSALMPRIGVPPEARTAFLAVTPVLIATWALGGLYLSLGPSLAIALLHTTSHVTGGLVIVALTATGSATAILTRAGHPERVLLGGAAMLALGVGVTLLGLNTETTALFFLGSVVAGVGFGAGFSGAFKTVVALAPPTERASLIAAIYVLSYLGFALPAVAAGVAVSHAGLLPTTNVYGSVVAALALAAMGLTLARRIRAE